jgi:hypothetical protein
MITDEQIKELREMRKKIENPGARETAKAKHIERNFDVISDDKRHRFSLILRQSTLVLESFTCGLLWHPPGGQALMLTRYNGSDHAHGNKIEGEEFGCLCHIHIATERYILAGKKSEAYAQPTDRYASVREALVCLTEDWNISGLKPGDSATSQLDLHY